MERTNYKYQPLTLMAILTFPHKALSLENIRANITCKVRYATLAAMTGPMTVTVAQPENVGNAH